MVLRCRRRFANKCKHGADDRILVQCNKLYLLKADYTIRAVPKRNRIWIKADADVRKHYVKSNNVIYGTPFLIIRKQYVFVDA